MDNLRLTDKESDILYDIAVGVWNRRVKSKQLTQQESEELFQEYVKKVWNAANNLWNQEEEMNRLKQVGVQNQTPASVAQG